MYIYRERDIDVLWSSLLSSRLTVQGSGYRATVRPMWNIIVEI